MKVGDMVKAIDGEIKGMLGVVTKIQRLDPAVLGGSDCADIFWNDGDHQSFVSTKYLEVVSK